MDQQDQLVLRFWQMVNIRLLLLYLPSCQCLGAYMRCLLQSSLGPVIKSTSEPTDSSDVSQNRSYRRAKPTVCYGTQKTTTCSLPQQIRPAANCPWLSFRKIVHKVMVSRSSDCSLACLERANDSKTDQWCYSVGYSEKLGGRHLLRLISATDFGHSGQLHGWGPNGHQHHGKP